MDLLAKSLTIDMWRQQIRSYKISISEGEGFSIIINNTKAAGSYINTIHSLVRAVTF